MGSKGWIKRVLPFFATFAVGIFIASFFVSVGPRWGRHGRWKMKAEIERLRTENEELKNENLLLRNDLQNLHWKSHTPGTRGELDSTASDLGGIPLLPVNPDIDDSVTPDGNGFPVAPPPPPLRMSHRPPRHGK